MCMRQHQPVHPHNYFVRLITQVVANNPQDHVIDYQASLQTALTLHFTRQPCLATPSISAVGNNRSPLTTPRTPPASASPPRTPTRSPSAEAPGTGGPAEEPSPMRLTPTVGDPGSSTSNIYVQAEDDEEFRVDVPLTDGDVSAVCQSGALSTCNKSQYSIHYFYLLYQIAHAHSTR